MKFLPRLLLCLPLLLALPAQADETDPGDDSSASAQAPMTSPDATIQAVAQELLGQIKQRREELDKDPDALYAMVDKVVVPHFDFPLMSRLVLGRAWEEAAEAQQARFLSGFKTLLIKTYSNALLQYSNQTVSFDPAQPGKKPTRASVKSTIQSPGEKPVFMFYRMRNKDGQWLVYDVVVDNISLITNYRGTYTAEVKRNGLDSLIQKLEEQAASKAS